MSKRFRKAWQQIAFLAFEVSSLNKRHWWRWIGCWFTAGFWTLASYRIERALFLLLGPAWQLVRVFLSPLIFLLRPWIGAGEISYRAEIGRGLRVLHPSLGVVISAKAQIGQNFVLVGGNCV